MVISINSLKLGNLLTSKALILAAVFTVSSCKKLPKLSSSGEVNHDQVAAIEEEKEPLPVADLSCVWNGEKKSIFCNLIDKKTKDPLNLDMLDSQYAWTVQMKDGSTLPQDAFYVDYITDIMIYNVELPNKYWNFNLVLADYELYHKIDSIRIDRKTGSGLHLTDGEDSVTVDSNLGTTDSSTAESTSTIDTEASGEPAINEEAASEELVAEESVAASEPTEAKFDFGINELFYNEVEGLYLSSYTLIVLGPVDKTGKKNPQITWMPFTVLDPKKLGPSYPKAAKEIVLKFAQDITCSEPIVEVTLPGDQTSYTVEQDLLEGSYFFCLKAILTNQKKVFANFYPFEFYLDLTPPQNPNMFINEGATEIYVPNATLSFTAKEAIEMYVTSDSSCAEGAEWEPFAETKEWIFDVTEPGEVSVFYQYKDDVGNTTECLETKVMYLGQPPQNTTIVINDDAEGTTIPEVTLTLSADDATEMLVSTDAECSVGDWEPYATIKAWTLTETNTTVNVFVKYRNQYMIESDCISDRIIHDDIPPTGSIDLGDGVQYSRTLAVQTYYYFSDATQMVVSKNPNDCTNPTWVDVAESAAWNLDYSNSANTIYFKLKDRFGNESDCLTSTIYHDDIPPVTSGFTINSGASGTNQSLVSLNHSASDASKMYITADAGCASGSEWENYSVSRSWSLLNLNASNTVYVKYIDIAGNETSCFSTSIIHDNVPPADPAVSINAGAATTSSASVNLTLQATDAGSIEMYITNSDSNCANGGNWETFNASKSFNLLAKNQNSSIYVKFKDNLGNETSCVSDAILHDDQAPTGSLSLDGGAAYTKDSTVDLTISATDLNSIEMYVTNTSGCGAGGSWESYSTSKNGWTLAQINSTATVYIQFRDSLGQVSTCYSDTIIHDNISPASPTISLNSGDTYVTVGTVSLALSASDTNTMEMYVTNTAGCGSGGNWESYATSKSGWSVGQTNQTTNVYVKYRDLALNESTCVSDAIIHDDIPPTAGSLQILAGATHTNQGNNNLTISAVDAGDMYVTNTSGCNSGGSWEAYATSKANWALDAGQYNQTATVYVGFRDAAGNTICHNDTIIHDNIAPTSTQINIENGADYVSDHTGRTLNLAATGASEVYITNTAGCGSGGSWDTYASTKSGWTLGQTNQTATVYAKYKDEAGNESACINDTIIHDSVAPSSHSISISSGATYTASTTVSLDLSATDVNSMEMYVTNTSGCTGDGSWEVLNSTKSPWTIAQTNTTATVYVKYRDAAGNVSTCVSDTIVHDSVSPSAPGSMDDGVTSNGSSTDTLVWTAATDTGSGLNTYEIAIGSTAGDTDILNWTDKGNVLTAVHSSLNLTWNNTYYVSVRAKDNAGNYSASSANGDGFLVGWKQQAYVKAANNTSGDEFANSVGVSGNLMITGAHLEDSNQTSITNGSGASSVDTNTDSGAAYIYSRDSSRVWTQQSYLKAGNNDSDDHFGFAVALDDTTAVVGAPEEDCNQTSISNGTSSCATNTASESGAVYVYTQSGSSWSQEAYVKGSNSAAGDRFGCSVDIDTDTLVAGSCSDDNTVADSGAVYVFTRSGSTWSQQQFIKAGNANGSDNFGFAVSLDQDTLAIGAPNEDSSQTSITNGTGTDADNTNGNSGAVYIYKRSGATWTQEAYLKAPNNTAGDQFGYSVSVQGDTLVVGAPFEDSDQRATSASAASNDNRSNSGAVYVFTRSGTTWSLQGYVKSSNADSSDQFGEKVVVSGDDLIVSAKYEGSNATTISNSSTASSDNTSGQSGAIFAFNRSGSTWTQKSYIKSPNNDPEDHFGSCIAFDSGTLVVGAVKEDSTETTITHGESVSTNDGSISSGAAYIITR